jgi:hypothetical protein
MSTTVLAQADGFTRVPICPWRPFGATALEDSNVEVCVYADRKEHGLQNAGWKWHCNSGREIYQKSAIARTEPSKLVYPCFGQVLATVWPRMVKLGRTYRTSYNLTIFLLPRQRHLVADSDMGGKMDGEMAKWMASANPRASIVCATSSLMQVGS